jgi:citrate synthase
VKARHLDAPAAAAELGVSLPTLYAYVSRGLIRSERGGNARSRRYRSDDIRALKERRQQRRNPARVAAVALHWGLPVLDSSISLIADGRLFYRGRDVAALATAATFEETAALLWTGDAEARVFADAEPPRAAWQAVTRVLDAPFGGASRSKARRDAAAMTPLDAFQAALPLAAVADPAAYDLRAEAVRRTGARIVRLLAATAVGRPPSAAPVASVLQRGWTPDIASGEPLLQATLVLCADHELNASTFTARCVASTGATPYAVVSAGLAALQGHRHGGASDRLEALVREVGSPRDARRVIAARLRRGESIPGFGHPLYPEGGDPRARILVELVERHRPRAPGTLLMRAVLDTMTELVGVPPNLDFGLVAVCRALGLPVGSAVGLMALARTAGWIAHALEQYPDERLIRPRARYVGAPPARGADTGAATSAAPAAPRSPRSRASSPGTAS